MSKRVRIVIESLERGGMGARDVLVDAHELLRTAWVHGYRSPFPDLEEERITSAEANELRRALADYCASETSGSHRRFALANLARTSGYDLRKQIAAELHICLEVQRVIGWDIFQLLLALEELGEQIFPPEKTSRSLTDLEENVEMASDYLQRVGINVPL